MQLAASACKICFRVSKFCLRVAYASSTLLLVEKRTVGGMELLCDVSRGKVWPLVPLVHRAAVFVAFHGLAHVGPQATKRRLIAAWVIWRGLNSNVSAWCKQRRGTAPIFYGSGSGSDFWKVMVLVPVLTFEKVMVPVPVHTSEKLRIRFRFQLHI